MNKKRKLIVLIFLVGIIVSIGIGFLDRSGEVLESPDLEDFGFGIEYAIPPILGQQVGMNDPAEFFSDTGTNWVKFSLITWNLIEPEAPIFEVHDYKWDNLDELVLNNQEKGYNIMMVLKSDAIWAVESIYGGINPSTPPRPEHWQDYYYFIYNLVERYDNDGIDDMPGLLSSVTHFEIESEAQHNGYWKVPSGKDRLEEYSELLQTAYQAAHDANPNSKIVLSGFNVGNIFDDGDVFTDQEIIDFYFAQASNNLEKDYILESFNFVYDSLALGDYYDVVEFHYNTNYNAGYGTVNLIKRKFDENNIVGKEIWAGDALIVTISEVPDYSDHYHPFPNLGPLVFEALHESQSVNSDHDDMWKWYLKDQAENLVKKTMVALDTGMRGMMAGNTADWADWWDTGIRFWTYGGYYGQEDSRIPNSVQGKRPVFYTSEIVADKISDLNNIEKRNIGEDIFFYKLIKNNGEEVFVAWYDSSEEKDELRLVNDIGSFFSIVNDKTEKIVDLSLEVGECVQIEHIVSELESTNNPKTEEEEIVLGREVILSENPIFIEVGSECGINLNNTVNNTNSTINNTNNTKVFFCGDNICSRSIGEDCLNCEEDCGRCPPPGVCSPGECDYDEGVYCDSYGQWISGDYCDHCSEDDVCNGGRRIPVVRIILLLVAVSGGGAIVFVILKLINKPLDKIPSNLPGRMRQNFNQKIGQNFNKRRDNFRGRFNQNSK